MSSKLKVETVCRKCIKPSSPTPPHLETFKLSLLDQLSPNIHGNMTLFYPPSPRHNPCESSAKSQLLQDSLSQTLTLFYPLAGTLRDAATIHCNDQGALFIESRTDASLADILATPDFDTIQHLLPTTSETSNDDDYAASSTTMLVVRFTSFACGSTAITISLTHKIADFAALITFLKAWTAACGGAGDTQQVVPELAAGAALFPPREIPGMSASVNIAAAEKFTTRRLVFGASKVEELKNRVKTEIQDHNGEQHSEGAAVFHFHPSRVEVVLALIWRCALLASKAKRVSFKPSALFQAVNLRPRMVPAVPDTAVGNFVWPFAVTVEEESHVELHVMVKKMRDAMKEFIETKAEGFKEEGGFGFVMEALKERSEFLKKKKKEEEEEEGNNVVVYKCTSWCKFPLHEVDFGWGKPVWNCSVNNMASNTIALMDTRDGGGVEAFVTLDEGHMPFFQHHHELLHYALLNPSLV